MAGAISEVARQSLAMDFRRIDPAAARIVLIEAGPRIMPTLPENLSDYVRRTLAKKGVEVMTSSRVMSCDRRPAGRLGRLADFADCVDRTSNCSLACKENNAA